LKEVRGSIMKKSYKILFVVCFCFLLTTSLFILNGQENKTDKIAIASGGETTDSQVEFQGGRAHWLIFFNDNGEIIETLENPFYQDRSQAGVKCAELLADKKISIFVAGNIGNKMADALEDFEITFISFTGTVEEAIAHILEK
jgi:predicted Fe-Mo cluster-binding NifX family protein